MAGNERDSSNRIRLGRSMVACGVFAVMAFACGPLEDEGQATKVPEAALARISEQPAALVESARKAMAAQEGFRGGLVYLPSLSEPRFTYGAPDAMLVEGMGGDFEDHMLFNDDGVFWSSDGRRWRTSPEQGVGLSGSFRTLCDPRMALRYGTDAEAAGEEEIHGRRHHVVRMKLDAQGLADDLGPTEPSVRISLNFPYPEGAEARNLERLGYEIFGGFRQESSSWELFKGDYHVKIEEHPRRPGTPRSEWQVGVYATVRGADSLEPGIERELRELLGAYGAEPDLINQARVVAANRESPGELARMFGQATVKLWIDAETYLVGRVAWEGPERGPEWVIGFWDYGRVAGLKQPQQVMDATRAEALGGVANAAFDWFRTAIEAYKTRHGQYPESADEGTLDSETGGPWPVNPFTGEPVRNAPESPGDIHYVLLEDSYSLSVYGWDNVMASTADGPPRQIAATPGPPPQPLVPPAAVQVRTSITPAAPTPGPTADLGPARAQKFAILWFGQERALVSPDGATMPALSLLEAQVCPQERACVWPVLLSYAADLEEKRFGIPALRISARARIEGESAVVGEPRRVAGLDATVQIERVALPYGDDQFTWEAIVWLPDSVVKISVSPFGKDPDRNPFNSEAGIALLVDALEPLK